MTQTLDFELNDLFAMVEALSDSLDFRVSAIFTDEPFREMGQLDVFQTNLEIMLGTYTKSFMALTDAGASDEFLDSVRFEQAWWDLFYKIQAAETFEDIPLHPPHDGSDGCKICAVIY